MRDDSSERLPRVVGPARLERRIGAGGMGTVYAAVLEEDVGEAAAGDEVAVKLLHPGRLDARHGLDRVRREAAVGMQLVHPGVVRLHGLVEAEDDGSTRLLLVMELVRGRTLRDLMDEMGTIPEPLLRHLAVHLARALAAVHAQGIVHRDVKPENVLIGADHEVKLTDMGLARSWSSPSDLTETGEFLGTFAYASPEHLGAGPMRPASDVYSLGVVLYEATCGRRPFDDSTLGGLVRQHLESRPRALGVVAAQVSPFLEDLVTCLLEKDPKRRVASGAELAEILSEAESSEWWRRRDGAAATPGDPPRRSARPAHESRFVGRDAELARARDAVRAGLRGEGAVLLIEGEAGIGKSRLVEEILGEPFDAADQPLVLRGQADATMGHGALAEAVVAHFGEARLADALSRHLADTPTIVPALVGELLGFGGADGRSTGHDALQAALPRLAASMARERPLVWVVEDLHRASARERALAVALAKASVGARLVVVATTRAELSPDDVAAWSRLGSLRMELGRLSARAVIDLLEGLLGSQRLAEDLGGKVAARTDGNPYFVVEIARDLKQRGALTRREDGTWTAKQRIGSIEVPSTVRALLLERLAGVPEGERAILDAAAAQGFRFDGDLVARMLGISRLHALQSLAALERRFRLVRASGAAYQFEHHQLQEVVLDAIPEPLRVELHALAARALVDRGDLDRTPAEGALAVRLVRHALAGHLDALASRHLRAALDHLRMQLDFETVVELCGVVTSRFPAEAPESALAGIRASLALEKLARLEESLAAGAGALAAALALGDSNLEGQARQALVAARFHMNDYQASLEMSELGLESARRARDRFTEGKLLGARGLALWFTGRAAESEESLRASILTLEEIDARGNLAVSLGNLATVLRTARRPGSDELYRRSIEMAEEVGEVGHAALMEGNLGSMLLERCEWEAGTTHVLRSLERSRLAGMRRTEAGNLIRLVDRAFALGELDEVERLLPITMDVATDASDLRVLGQVHSATGELARLAGRHDEAARCYDTGLSVFRKARARAELVPHLLRKARLEWDADDGPLARALVDEAIAHAPRSDAHLRAWTALVHGAPAPALEEVDELPVVLRLEVHALLARAGSPGHVEAAAALAEVLTRTFDATARDRFMTRGIGRHAVAAARGSGWA